MTIQNIKINNLKNSFKLALSGLTWQPSGNSKSTRFAHIYLSYDISGLKGSPFLIIMDNPPQIDFEANGLCFKMTPFNFFVCVENSKLRPEDNIRIIIDAYEALEIWLNTPNNLNSLGIYGYQYKGYENLRIKKTNIVGRSLILNIKSKITV